MQIKLYFNVFIPLKRNGIKNVRYKTGFRTTFGSLQDNMLNLDKTFGASLRFHYLGRLDR